ncbi:MAG: tetratricopeptide repeat protein [Gemmatimonadaceae bacterium]
MSEYFTGDLGQRRAQSLALLAVALLAVIASLSGIQNGFALDDVHIIVENSRVHALSEAWRMFGQTYWPPDEGASLYRPLTIMAFAVQWAVGHGSAFPFHLTNILLYAAVAVALFRLALLLVPLPAAFVAAALFAVHPIHTEVVANVVGQAELWVALLVIVAVFRYVRARREGRLSYREVAILTALYFVACMFKEHAIVLPALFVAAEVTVVGSKRYVDRARELWPLFITLAFSGIIFVLLRTLVVGRLAQGGPNVLLLGVPYSTRFFTMLHVFMEWIRLFVWPASLSADYSSRRIEAATSFDASMIAPLLVIGSLVAIAWSVRRSKPAVTFGFLWAGVNLLMPSNLVVVTGNVLAERTLFLASGGLAICAGVAALELWNAMSERGRGPRLATAAALLGLLGAGILRSSTRNVAWHDNETLFRQTVADVPTSYRAHWMLAEYLTDAGQTAEGLDEMLLAVALGRKNDPGLLSFAADRFRMANQCPRAMGMYRKALDIDPTLPELRFGASVCLLQLGKFDEAKALARQGLKSASNDNHLRRVLIVADSLANLSKKQISPG